MERKSESRFQSEFSSLEGGAAGEYTPSIMPEVFLRPDVHERRSRLAEIIADQIIPRLQSIHHNGAISKAPAAFSADEIAEFGALAIGMEAAAPAIYFQKLRGRGHSVESLFETLLAPTARHLGELWKQDRCDFVDVTLGVARLQELLERFELSRERAVSDRYHRALLISTPDEKHMFGVEMVARFMRGAGWEVEIEKGLDARQNAAAVATEWFGVAGVTLSCEAGLEVVAHVISSVRRASLNRSIRIMVGGPAFVHHPELVAQVGADAAAPDAPTAVLLAKKLLLQR